MFEDSSAAGGKNEMAEIRHGLTLIYTDSRRELSMGCRNSGTEFREKGNPMETNSAKYRRERLCQEK
jgi:hypothetical protein